ncbi:MAG: HAD-IIIA family hydrolase [Bacteroidetes bacterium]|nr:HAD-IIIA family hydrolase [Bacteroidota bacterium]
MLPIEQVRTLFLDRDGVINKRRVGKYVKAIEEFEFLPGVLLGISQCRKYFDRIVVVTNQQGIGKGLMDKDQLDQVHEYMLRRIEQHKGHIDGVYSCSDLNSAKANCRKPGPTMAFQAKADFPEINFSYSVMVGDSISDMEFGKNLGMKCAWIEGKEEEKVEAGLIKVDFRCKSLLEFIERYAESLFH